MRFLFVLAFLAMLATTTAALFMARDGRATQTPRPAATALPAEVPGRAATTSAPVLSPDPPAQPRAAAPLPEPPALVPAPVAPATTAAPTPVVERAGAGAAPADPLGAWGSPPAPDLDPRPFSEAHWQGLELIPKTATLAETLKLPPDVRGVIVDDVGLPADLQGFRAGDLVVSVGAVPTPDLLSLIRAADSVREQRQVEIEIFRGGTTQRLALSALFERLGTANGETPTMIPPGARSPHPYQGACTKCHRIGTTGSLATDQGDTAPGAPPPIRAGSTPPHRDRGPCSSCHQTII